MQISSVFFLLNFGSIVFPIGTFGSLSRMTFESNIRLSNWKHSMDSSLTLIILERLEENE